MGCSELSQLYTEVLLPLLQSFLNITSLASFSPVQLGFL